MNEKRTVERFKKRTIWLHWIHTAAFVVLVVTGATLFFPGTASPAGGGLVRLLHRIAVVFFAGIPAIYAVWNPRTSLNFIRESLTWNQDDYQWMYQAPDYYSGGDEERMPPQGRVNTIQKLWQLVILATGLLFVITGFPMWFLKDVIPPVIFQWCLIVHDVAFLLTSLMMLVHVYTAAVHPRMTESLRSMWDGKISRTYARKHYAKWYEEVSEEDR